jgi:hypothetical protein
MATRPGKRRLLLASEPCSAFSNSKELTETNDNGRDAGHPRDPYQLAKTVFGTARRGRCSLLCAIQRSWLIIDCSCEPAKGIT